MGTLYVVSIPAGDLEDITFRARRILEEVSFIIAADDLPRARSLLDRHGIGTPILTDAGDQAHLATLEQDDVALLLDSRGVAPTGTGHELIRAAIERQLPVVPVPGPSLPIAALVASGLPTASFVYLGELPAARTARRELLAAAAVQERTLLLSASFDQLAETVADLYHVLGERPVVIIFGLSTPANGKSRASEPATGPERGVWRGSTADAVERHLPSPQADSCILVVGGAQEPVILWEESRLRDEIQTLLEQGLRTREISQELAGLSGWSRRDVYRLAVEEAKDLNNH